MTVYVILKFVTNFRTGLGGMKSLLFVGRREQTGRGVFLILEYQKSFRRPYLSTHTFV